MELETRALLDSLFDRIDRLDYYVVLGVERDADAETIRQAFYARAEVMHPDRHYNIVDTDLREKLYTVYKRVAEAYRVLSSADTRKEYDAEIKLGRTRHITDSRRGNAQRDPELSIRNLRARRLYLDAKSALGEGNPKGAHIALRMAQSFEPGNELIDGLLAEITTALALPK